MERKFLIIMVLLPLLPVLAGCGKEENPQGAAGPGEWEGKEPAPHVEKLYVELNGQGYCALPGGGGYRIFSGSLDDTTYSRISSFPTGQEGAAGSGMYGSDTIRLQEEGLRSLRIVGWEPENAASVKVDSVSFHHDIYSFNYAQDSIVILGGGYALPCNHYICNVGEGLQGWQGVSVSEAEDAKFYNYTAPEYDYATIGEDGEFRILPWVYFGKYRRFRIVVSLEQEGECRFEIPFYELPNTVEAVTDGGEGIIAISPGDSLRLEYVANAPEEFAVFEWGMGVATERFAPLNAEAVEESYFNTTANPSLTEEGMRYTASKVHLSREGVLTVDADWEPEHAESSGGGIYNEVPVCVVAMPAGNPLVEAMARSFIFPQGERRNFLPTPFFCNVVVRISAANGRNLQFAGKEPVCSK